MKAPEQLVLEKELLNGEIKKVLFYHNTDRWYFGDLLRHSSWIEILGQNNIHLTVATNKNFLSIFENHPFVKKLIPVDIIKEKDFSKYDLVIIPSSFSPLDYSSYIRRGIYTYNSALEYTRYGILIQKIKKEGFNYFNLAKHKFGQTYLPDSSCFKIHLTHKEKLKADTIIHKFFLKNKKIIILNPTASNPFTRETNIKKEVTNILNINDYLIILKNLLLEFPKHSILIASTIKANDQINFNVIEKLTKLVSSRRVRSITSITTLEKGFSFREFAGILSSPMVDGILGNGTGTNTHFATACDLPSMSIERSVDRETLSNWGSKDLFKMGSFRWRNPELSVGTYTLDWHKKNQKDFKKICHIFKLHLALLNSNWQDLLHKGKINSVIETANKILLSLESGKVIEIIPELNIIKNSFKNTTAKRFYFDFNDEIKYLKFIACKKNLRFDKISKSEEKIFLELIMYSNLYKFLINIRKESFKETIFKNNLLENATINIFKKIRAGILLSKKDLKKIDFLSEVMFQEWINKNISKSITSVINSFKQKTKNEIKGSWQNRIYVDSRLNLILKIIDINKKSVYFRKNDTIKNIKFANRGAGGVIPSQTEIKIYNRKYAYLVNKVIPFMTPYGFDHGILNNKIFNSVLITQNKLAFGWIDEFIDNFIKLAKRGIYNMDYRFADTGIDKFGIFYMLDPGYSKDANSIKSSSVSIKNPLYLGINVLARNRVLLNNFKNGSECVKYHDEQVKKRLKIDLSSFSLKWKFGDHANTKIRPTALKFKKILLSFKKETPRPVYPLINFNFEQIILDLINKRLKNNELK